MADEVIAFPATLITDAQALEGASQVLIGHTRTALNTVDTSLESVLPAVSTMFRDWFVYFKQDAINISEAWLSLGIHLEQAATAAQQQDAANSQ